VRIEIHKSKRDEAHFVHRGIGYDDIMQVVEGENDARKRGRRLVVIGRARDLVLLVVLERWGPIPWRYRVVTARRATRIEKRLLARRGRKHT
jgi:uncharacterized DUF497 family protein